MSELYKHQLDGIDFLRAKQAAGLFWEMGTGKSRTALLAARALFDASKIDRVLVLCPAAVKYAWASEIAKLVADDEQLLTPAFYNAKEQRVYLVAKQSDFGKSCNFLPVLIVSYALLQQERHVKMFERWAFDGECALIADESSFLKNRTAKQTKGAAKVAASCVNRWLLTGTPIANSPLDLYGQNLVMSSGKGPLKRFSNYYHFQSAYAVTKQVSMRQIRFKQVIGYQNLDDLQRKFAPYVSRVEKKDCLDLPPKTYTVREVALSEETWKIYQELKREAMLALGDGEERPEPNAAVRLLRLCQLTSGHVGTFNTQGLSLQEPEQTTIGSKDVSSEKLSFLVDAITEGELSSIEALIVWCRWRRERERLQEMLAGKIQVNRIFGGQQEKNRSFEIQDFMTSTKRRILVAQQHAGGYGLTLTAASTAVYLSNTFSYTDRVQSEDRIHRSGQRNVCLYVDILTTGPKGQRTVDHFVAETLREKHSLAELTCSAWREALGDE